MCGRDIWALRSARTGRHWIGKTDQSRFHSRERLFRITFLFVHSLRSPTVCRPWESLQFSSDNLSVVYSSFWRSRWRYRDGRLTGETVGEREYKLIESESAKDRWMQPEAKESATGGGASSSQHSKSWLVGGEVSKWTNEQKRKGLSKVKVFVAVIECDDLFRPTILSKEEENIPKPFSVVFSKPFHYDYSPYASKFCSFFPLFLNRFRRSLTSCRRG